MNSKRFCDILEALLFKGKIEMQYLSYTVYETGDNIFRVLDNTVKVLQMS